MQLRAHRFVALAGLALGLGGCFGAPRYEGPPSGHFDGHAFENQVAFEPRGVADILRWQLAGDAVAWPDWANVARPPPPPGQVTSGVRITFVNHATVLVQMAGVNILTDPVWADRIGPVSWIGPSRHKAPGIAFAELPHIDLVVLSHNHYDHLDVATLRRLSDRDAPLVLAGLGSRALLVEAGVGHAEDMDWWQSRAIGDVKVTFTPAQHWSRRGLGDDFAELWGGFYFAAGETRVFFAGDTASGPHFAQIADRLGPPTVALLPIGAYLPTWFMRSQHIGPREAVAAHRALGARTSIAIHWGTFDLADEGMYQPAGELMLARRAAALPSDSFVVLENGEQWQSARSIGAR